MVRPLAIVALVVGATGCVRGGHPTAAVAPAPVHQSLASNLPSLGDGAPEAPATATAAGVCVDCGPSSLTIDERRAVERRIADLKARGGHCSSYGAILERSYRGGQITIRPYMWRVGAQLASGEARPDGAMILAREIDPLNVGRRTFDEVLWTMEHEAAHIAFNLDSPRDAGPGDRADEYVRACRS